MGEALWDVLPDGKKIGGAPANFAYHVSQFGFDSRVVSAIGDDESGDEILSVFDEKTLKYHLPKVGFPTGTVQVTLDEDGIPAYEIKTGVAWDNIPFTPELEELASKTGAICFGSLAQRSPVSRETISRFLSVMDRNEDCLKIFDINLRQHFFSMELILDSLSRCNILKINDEELIIVKKMLGIETDDSAAICQKLIADFHLRMLILTCGTKGSHVFTPTVSSFEPTPQVTVADTVGAGDSFTASFCAAILKGHPVKTAHRFAVEVSAHVCSCHGAMPKLPQALIAKI